jgi:DNA polymerase
MSTRRAHYLARLGIAVYERRPTAAAGPEPDAHAVPEPAPSPLATDAWVELAARVAACTRCALHRGRTQTVFGVGRRDAEIMVIGEAPGAEEDRQGEPFVGRAGQLLNAMLHAIGFPRDEVYIANILKCRPPNNRDPSPEETGRCTEYLREQIDLVAPRALLIGKSPHRSSTRIAAQRSPRCAPRPTAARTRP